MKTVRKSQARHIVGQFQKAQRGPSPCWDWHPQPRHILRTPSTTQNPAWTAPEAGKSTSATAKMLKYPVSVTAEQYRIPDCPVIKSQLKHLLKENAGFHENQHVIFH